MNSALPDTDRLARWMDEQGLGAGPIEDLRLLTGGSQNILLRMRRGACEFVLRRPPLNPRPGSDGIMLREARLLAAIADSDVPHPGLIAACADTAVIGTAFYLMEPVDGYNPVIEMPSAACDDKAARRRMGFDLVDGLAALARLDPINVGLADFGKLDGWLERQVKRWRSELESYARYPAWTGRRELGDIDQVADWLERFRPARQWNGIIHGDYHVGNGIFDDDGALLAIVDWEMATLGDPMLDFCRFLLSWPEEGQATPFTMRVRPLDGFPSRGEMIRRFAERTGCDLDPLPWFQVLASYKLGIILEGSYARAQAGEADAATGVRLHASACALLDHARQVIAAT